jgi:hypothetical protein
VARVRITSYLLYYTLTNGNGNDGVIGEGSCGGNSDGRDSGSNNDNGNGDSGDNKVNYDDGYVGCNDNCNNDKDDGDGDSGGNDNNVNNGGGGNAILEHIHAVVMNMLCIAAIDMANTVKPSDINVFLSDTAWVIYSTHHTALKTSPGAAIFGQDMLFDIPFIADWKKIGEHIVGRWIIFLLETPSLGQHVQTNYCNTCKILFVLNLHCAG